MADYKVIFRIARDHPDGHYKITWERGCPLLFEAVQISRNIKTGKAFLQAKARNICSETISTFQVGITCRFKNGTSQVYIVEPLDADIHPGEEYTLSPIELARGDAVNAEAKIQTVVTSSKEWTSLSIPEELPQRKLLDLSKKALAERALQIEQKGCKECQAAAPYAIEKHGNWIMCACGQVSMDLAFCPSCGLDLGCDMQFESENDLIRLANTRAEQKKEEERERAAREQKRKRILRLLLPASVAIAMLLVGIGVAYGSGYLGGEPQIEREAKERVLKVVQESRGNMEPLLDYLGADVSETNRLKLPDDLKQNVHRANIMGLTGEVTYYAKNGVIVELGWQSDVRLKHSEREIFIESLNDYFGNDYRIREDKPDGYEWYTYDYYWEDENVSCTANLSYSYRPKADDLENDDWYVSLYWSASDDPFWNWSDCEKVTVA